MSALANTDDLAKGLAAHDEALAKLSDLLGPLIKTVEEMKTRLAPPRAAGAGAAFSKGDDGAGGARREPSHDDLASALASMTDDQRDLVLAKAALMTPRAT